MALWPRDERVKSTAASKPRTGLAKEQHRDYPNIGQGLIGAATLVQAQNKRLQWSFLNKPSSYARNGGDERLKFGKHIEVFAPSSLQTTVKTTATVRQRAELGANFLRTYVPDAEVPEELIRAHLVEDTTRSRQLEVFDPYEGNPLDVVYDSEHKVPSLLLFPTGPIKQHLSYAHLQYSESGVLFGKPARPLHTFSTPIQQVVSRQHEGSAEDSLLAVRTFTKTEVLNVKQDDLAFRASSIASLTHRETNGEGIVDLAHAVDSRELLILGGRGSLFSFDFENGGRQREIHTGAKEIVGQDNELWRVTPGLHSQHLITTNTRVLQLDARTKSSSDFLSLPTGKGIFTSAGNIQGNILCLSSTESVVWMDIRFLRKPLISYAHNRQQDRYLTVHTLPNHNDNSLTFLTSHSDSLVQVFDVKQATDRVLQFEAPVYTIPSNLGSYNTNLGQRFVHHENNLGLLSLSEAGGVSYTEIITPNAHTERSYTLDIADAGVELETSDISRQPALGPLEIKEHSEVDFRVAYEALFQEHFDGTKEREDEDAEAVYQMLDSFPSFFQTKELPIETMLTTYDVTFRAGDEPRDPKSADFLADGHVCSKRGVRALKQGKLSPELVKTSWKRSINDTLHALDQEYDPDPLNLIARYSRYKLSSEQYVSSKAREFEQDAAEYLALDLSLSSNIYSESPFVQREDKTQTLEFMTEALSLGNSPPQVQFGYLRPVQKNHYNKAANNGPLQAPAGVCSLLQAWDSMGLEDYTYQDPYGAAADAPSPTNTKPAVAAPKPSAVPTVVPTQRPPVIVTSTVVASQPDYPTRRAVPPVIQSQRVNTFPERRAEPTGFVESQPSQSSFPDLMVSTQVLPGPHGGRPAAKKKPAKKRLGGF